MQIIGVYQYLQPVATLIAAWFLLSEKPTEQFVSGAVLVLLGIYSAEAHRLPTFPRRKRQAF